MKTEVVDISSVVKEVKIEIEAEAIKKVHSQVIQRYARMANIPGFRKGNAPASMVATRFKEDIDNEVLREIVPERVTTALRENDLNPLVEPELHIENQKAKLDGSEDLKLHIHVQVLPKIETPNYKGLEGVRRVRPLAEDEVDKVIEGMRQEQSFLAPVEDRKSESGDTVIVDIKGEFLDDHNQEPVTAEDLEIELGGEGVEETFSNNLMGVEADDVRTFIVEYPADFTSPALAGKSVEYTATVKSVGKLTLPEVDDDFVQSFGEDDYKTIDEMRQKIQEDLEKMAKLEADNRLRDELVDKLVETHQVEVPPALITAQAQDLVNNFANQMAQRGMDPRQADPKLWEMVYQKMLPQAEREVRGAMLLDKIAETENVEITPEEVEAEIQNIARYTRRPIEEVRNALAKDDAMTGLNERLRNRRAVEIILENATITDGEWIEPSTESDEISDDSEETPESLENETDDQADNQAEKE